jgi:cupin fold WbuC family metalloprotein
MAVSFVIENQETYYSDSPVILVSREEIRFLKARAGESSRRRATLCTHPNSDASLHEMLIVNMRGTYVRPHSHEGRSESVHVIEGCARLVLFDKGGAVTHVVPMAEVNTDATFYYRIPSGTIHTFLVDSEAFVFHETTSGPFRPGGMVCPEWAPIEQDAVQVRTFLNKLGSRLLVKA